LAEYTLPFPESWVTLNSDILSILGFTGDLKVLNVITEAINIIRIATKNINLILFMAI
jgi:hypothetical protein